MKKKIYKSGQSGKFVSKDEVQANPDETYSQTVEDKTDLRGFFGLKFNGEVIAYCKYQSDLEDLEGSYLDQEGEIERFEVKEK